MHNFACLTASDIEANWDRLVELLAPAIDKCDHETTVEDVLLDAIDGKLYVAVLEMDGKLELACVMGLAHYPQKTVLSIQFVGGRHLLLFAKEYGHHIGDFARECGASDVEFHSAGSVARLARRAYHAREVRHIFRIEVPQ